MSRAVMQQALEALEDDCLVRVGPHSWERKSDLAILALKQALAEPEQEPVATKQMLQWVEHLKRLSDDGQHMSIPGLSSGACWELAIELEQFIKNTAPTPRKPLTDEEMRECAQAMNAEPLAEGWPELIKFARAIERHHGIGEQHE